LITQEKENAQNYSPQKNMKIYATYSIVGVNAKTGEIGSAAASCALAVGSAVIHFNENMVLNTQHFASPMLAYQMFLKTNKGESAKDALASILENDAEANKRQIIIATKNKEFFAHTGAECESKTNHVLGKNCVAAGNTLIENSIIDRMVTIFEKNKSKSLAFRLLIAIKEGERLAADKRGKQSAALKVTAPHDLKNWFMYPDLRVDDHEYPVQGLSRLWKLFEERKKKWS